jgi:uncharacterized membrane protein
MQITQIVSGAREFARAKTVAVLAIAGAAVSSAMAAGVDVTTTTTDLADVKTAVLAIGVAVLSIVVGIKLYKWVKQAL